MKPRLVLATLALLCFAAEPPARAQVAPTPAAPAAPAFDASTLTPLIEQVASENLRRLRRGVAFGPRLSVAGLYRHDPVSSLDAQLAAGLAFYTFKVPLTFELQRVVIERVRARLIENIKRLVDEGRPPSDDDIRAQGRTLFEQIADEVLGRHQRLDRTFEDPGFGLSIEGSYQPRAGAGLVRVTPTLGLFKFNLGPTFVAHLSDDSNAFLGGEISVRVTPAQGPRPTVYEPFYRLEVPLFKRDRYGLQSTIGVRLLFDLL